MSAQDMDRLTHTDLLDDTCAYLGLMRDEEIRAAIANDQLLDRRTTKTRVYDKPRTNSASVVMSNFWYCRRVMQERQLQDMNGPPMVLATDFESTRAHREGIHARILQNAHKRGRACISSR